MLEHKTHLNVRLSYAKVCSCDNKKRYYFTVVSHHDVMIIVNHLLKQVGRMVIRIFFCSFSFCFLFVCLLKKNETFIHIVYATDRVVIYIPLLAYFPFCFFPSAQFFCCCHFLLILQKSFMLYMYNKTHKQQK